MKLYKEFKLFGARVLNKVSAGTDLTIKKDDVFIVSYPKSGNTWTRFLVANLAFGKSYSITFNNIENFVPDIYVQSDHSLMQISSPRYLKSHAFFTPKYKKIIKIIRDPRDVAVSTYYFWIKLNLISENVPIEEFIKKFLAGEGTPYGTWYENIGSWIGAKQDNMLIIRYEDLLYDGLKTIQQLNHFLGLNCTEEDCIKALQSSNIKAMQNMEREQGNDWAPMKKGSKRDDILFCRSGKNNQWKKELSIESAEMIWNEWGSLMAKLGYNQDGSLGEISLESLTF